VPPRDVAAFAIRDAVRRGGWVVGWVALASSVIIAIDLSTVRPGLPLRESLVFLVVFSCAFAILNRRPSLATAIAFLLVGGVTVGAYQAVLMSADPELSASGVYLLNRPSLVLVLVGGVGRSYRSVMILTGVGYLVSVASTVSAGLAVGQPPPLGLGGILTMCILMTTYLALAIIQSSTHRRVPELDRIEREAVVDAMERRREQSTAALIHDTVLSDLAIIMASAGTVDDKSRERLRSDVAHLTRGRLDAPEADLVVSRTELYRRFVEVVNEFQWRGLTVNVTGARDEVLAVSSERQEAVIGAMRASLDNVLQHAGTAIVEINTGRTGDDLTVMVIDDGVGFNPDDIADDRLGIRSSIFGRIEAVGGTVRLWSRVGFGASVVLSVPLCDELITDTSRVYGATDVTSPKEGTDA
jgi:hypothetical protein